MAAVVDQHNKPNHSLIPFFDMIYPTLLATGLFLILITVVALFQFALVCGAPWGELTLGGRWRGRLPWYARLIASLSLGILAWFGIIVSARANLITP